MLEKETGEKINSPKSLKEILKRPKVSYTDLPGQLHGIHRSAIDEIEASIKYAGYIERQRVDIERLQKNENTIIPDSKNANIIRIVSNANDSIFIPNIKKINMNRETARDNCWENWGENYKSSWDSTINGIMSYDLDNVYMFKPTIGKQPKMQNDTGSFVNSFYFCTFNEGYSMSDLEAYQKALFI